MAWDSLLTTPFVTSYQHTVKTTYPQASCKLKQIPKIDILYSRYSRKNKKTTGISRIQDVYFRNLYIILYFLKLSACRGFMQVVSASFDKLYSSILFQNRIFQQVFYVL